MPPIFKITPKSVDRLKQKAKEIKKKQLITQAKALDQVARDKGFSSWKAIISGLEEERKISPTTPLPSLNFVTDNEVVLTKEEESNLQGERKEELANEQKLNVADNRTFLAKHAAEYSIFEPTIIGLNKSILDATQQVRTHFELCNYHLYQQQKQGPDYKVVNKAVLLSEKSCITTTVSLYRPVSKKGDTRMWFPKLKQIAEAGSQVAIIIVDGVIYLINLSAVNLKNSYKNRDNIGDFFTQKDDDSSISQELLKKLRKLAQKPLEAVGHGDTTIGMTIEDALDIPANSSKKPDYKGIELKSGRNNSKNRKTLFAQVADWKNSVCRSSAEVLDKYGYQRGDDFKLYCSVSSQKENSQGLKFEYLESKDELVERHATGGDVVTWSGELLRNRLKEKHAETFWITATTETIEGKEYFTLETVTHTRLPLLSQLMPLIDSGVITMDHLIKRKKGQKVASEKGPLFKISDKNLSLLFPDPISYDLRSKDIDSDTLDMEMLDQITCKICNGKEIISGAICEVCNGMGTMTIQKDSLLDELNFVNFDCPKCRVNINCAICHGTGKINRDKALIYNKIIKFT